MSNFPNMNPMVMPPPPPPPPPNPMEMEAHVGMMPPMMDTYNEEMMKMGLPVDNYNQMGGPHMVPGFLPQPPMAPPPQVSMVPNMPVPQQPMALPPQLGMLQNMNFQTTVDSRHLIDPYLAAEISSIVHTLSTSQLVYVLAALKKFLKHAPSEARRFLLNNPQLTYALLHTQFILGEHDESVLPLSKVDHDISHVNKLERSMHLKPFHNLYEDQGVPPQMPTYQQPPVYPPHEQIIHQQHQMAPERDVYQSQRGHVQKPRQTGPHEATQSDIDELVNQGIYPASAALVDEVIKNQEILTNIQKSTIKEMESWPLEQKQQVLSIKMALHMRGISVIL